MGRTDHHRVRKAIEPNASVCISHVPDLGLSTVEKSVKVAKAAAHPPDSRGTARFIRVHDARLAKVHQWNLDIADQALIIR